MTNDVSANDNKHLETRVAILLPTYNGAVYLAEQLDSLLAQSHSNFVVVTRDDGSRDGCIDVMGRYAETDPQRFHVVQSDGENLGACASFSYLMQYVLENKAALGLESAYMLFCDQDDVWMPNKIERSLRVMQEQEAQNPNTPVLVHSDLEVVDEDLSQISASMAEYQALKPAKKGFGRLLVSNTVTGCAMFTNESLAELSLPIPDAAIMHDWWLALCASSNGEMQYIEESLVRYRQHRNNTLGAHPYIPIELGQNLGVRFSAKEQKGEFLAKSRQARVATEVLHGRLSSGDQFLARLVSLVMSRGGIASKLLQQLLS